MGFTEKLRRQVLQTGEKIKRKLKKFIKILEGKKGEDIKILDVRKLTWITDYFIILTGNSIIQTKTIAQSLLEGIKEKPISVEGLEEGKWILLDYQDVMIHIFLPQIREFYRLEKLWGDAKIVELKF